MTDYRIVARHVRYWRGAVHKWSTVYPITGSISPANYGAVIAALKVMEQAVNYKTTGTVAGGLYEIALYDHATGGVPVAVTTYFPWATPGSWVAYGATAWPLAGGTALCTEAETSLQVEWAAGLSTSGKPVTFKKWYHAVPNSVAAPGAVDVQATDATALAAAFTSGIAAMSGLGGTLGNSSRLAATTPVVRLYYGNHQMPRGRKRKVSALRTGSSFPASVLVVPGSDGSLS